MITPQRIKITKEFIEQVIKIGADKMHSSPEWKKIAELRAQNDHATIKTDKKENET